MAGGEIVATFSSVLAEPVVVAVVGRSGMTAAGTAFELARAEWGTSLMSDYLPADLEPLSLDDAMKFLHRHSSPE